jgi:hypothetical protein
MDIVLIYGRADYSKAVGGVDKLISLNGWGQIAVIDNEAQMRPAINPLSCRDPIGSGFCACSLF